MSANLPEGFDSIFRYIAVVSQRAEQLINGAKVRSETRSSKSTLQAKDDVDLGLVEWRVLTQEEIDAQRQAIVDQFRAEVGAEELSAMGPQSNVPDVLRTEPVPSAEAEPAEIEPAEPGERDDELARLQRLLGLSVVDDDKAAGEAAEASEEESLEMPNDEDLTLDVEEESYEEQSFGDDGDDPQEDE